MTDLFDAIQSQRACRAFAPTAVADETIGRLLDAAVHAPSAENRQPWEFVVVRSPETRSAIAALMARLWDQGGRAHAESRIGAAMLLEVEVAMTSGFATAPVLVVVGADVKRGSPRAAESSIYPAVQNLLLAAGALGLGTALTTIALAAAAELGAMVGLPDHVRPMAVVPVGYPARPMGPPRREPFATHTHRDRFGTPWDQGTVGSS